MWEKHATALIDSPIVELRKNSYILELDLELLFKIHCMGRKKNI